MILPYQRYPHNRHHIIYNSICIPLHRILADPYLRSFKNSGSIFRAHKTPYITKYNPFAAIQKQLSLSQLDLHAHMITFLLALIPSFKNTIV